MEEHNRWVGPMLRDCIAAVIVLAGSISSASAGELVVSFGDVTLAPEHVGDLVLAARTSLAPVWPEDAPIRGVDVTCTVKVSVDAAGRPFEVASTVCPEAFFAATAEALRHWSWEPIAVKGQPARPRSFTFSANFAATVDETPRANATTVTATHRPLDGAGCRLEATVNADGSVEDLGTTDPVACQARLERLVAFGPGRRGQL